jgi:hypothetical protein
LAGSLSRKISDLSPAYLTVRLDRETGARD